MKKHFLIVLVLLVAFSIVLSFSACNIISKEIDLPDNSQNKSISTAEKSDDSMSSEQDSNSQNEQGDQSGSQSVSQSYGGLEDGGYFSAHI